MASNKQCQQLKNLEVPRPSYTGMQSDLVARMTGSYVIDHFTLSTMSNRYDAIGSLRTFNGHLL